MSKTEMVLNQAFAKDPSAIRALSLNRVPCNQLLADDEFVMVEKDIPLSPNAFFVGAFGLVNAVLLANGLAPVEPVFDHAGSHPVFVGFKEMQLSSENGQ